jgi:hypothetical protein
MDRARLFISVACIAILQAVVGLSWAAGAEGPVLPRGPYLQALLEESVHILWLTEEPAVGHVRYGEEGKPSRTVGGGEPMTRHDVVISRLQPDTTYVYDVIVDDVPVEEGLRFHTAPRANEGTVRIAVTGDRGSADARQRTVAARIRASAPHLFLHTGDLDYVHDPDRSVFQPYKEILAEACFYPTRGNHDIFPWFLYFVAPEIPPDGTGTYYSFDWGSGHFVALDTGLSLDEDKPQVRWLLEDLAAAKEAGRRWIVLYFHDPIYTVGAYSIFPLPAREALAPIIDRFEVDLVLTGHDHNYQRSHPVRGGIVLDAWQDPTFVRPRGTIYVLTGGGGGVLYDEIERSDHRFTRIFEARHHFVEMEMTRDRISLRAIGDDGEVLDSCLIEKEGPRPELTFLRGDVNSSGDLTLTDAIETLRYLFEGAPLDCPASADANDSSGSINIVDPVYVLNFLFLGGPPPAAPYPDCGAPPDLHDAFCTRAGCTP